MNVKKILGFLAIGGLLVLAAPAERAQALSLINPGIAAAVQDDSSKLTTEVRWHLPSIGWRRHHWHHRHWRLATGTTGITGTGAAGNRAGRAPE